MTDKPSQEWIVIENNRQRLLTRKSAAFIGYCRQQANKYGIKGSRVAAAKAALELLEEALEKHGSQAKLFEVEDELLALVNVQAHTSILDIPGAIDISGIRYSVRHLEVCNRKMPYTQTIKSARDVIQRIVDDYGLRARQAERNQGVDWKALSHAVRVGTQAIELLTTSHVTFPRPERDHLVAIKTGMLQYQAVAEEIDDLLIRVEETSKYSTLPLVADQQWIDDFVANAHYNAIRSLE